jgi:hypothetical protein
MKRFIATSCFVNKYAVYALFAKMVLIEQEHPNYRIN